ncbi:hypothetical protein ABEB36_014480 [Hypothenemus hampei]|uniref:Uncharacterized protein n=1 Tax=Hypothenemus hampei TaxID=57062 RepID=A0ABD1E6K4_HYPHA
MVLTTRLTLDGLVFSGKFFGVRTAHGHGENATRTPQDPGWATVIQRNIHQVQQGAGRLNKSGHQQLKAQGTSREIQGRLHVFVFLNFSGSPIWEIIRQRPTND